MKNQRWLPVLCILVIVPYLLLSFAVHPAGDDFWYANSAIENGYWGGQYKFYQEWTGRYLATAGLNLSAFTLHGRWFYQLFPIVLLITLGYAGYSLLRRTTGDLFSTTERGLASLGFMALLLSNLPIPSQGIYWWPGTVTYMLPVAIAAFNACILVPHYQQPRAFTAGELAALLAAAFIIVGCNETAMLMWLYMCVSLLVWDYICVKKIFPRNVLLLLASSCFAAVVILAPGNTHRGAEFPDSHRPFFTFWQSLVEVGSHLGQFVSLALLAATGLFIGLLLVRGPAPKMTSTATFRWTLLLFLGFMYCGFFPSLWAMGYDPPERVDNMTYYLFLWFWFLLVYQWTDINRAGIEQWLGGKKWISPTLLIITLALGFILARNNSTAWYDLVVNATSYNEAYELRYRMYADGEGKHLVVRPIEPIPETLYVYDINPSTDEWHNRIVAQYYKLASVRVAD